MGFGGGSNPAATASAVAAPQTALPVPVPPVANPPTLAGSPGVLANARTSAARVKAAGGMGFDNTIGTSPQGLTEKVNLAQTTLLGS